MRGCLVVRSILETYEQNELIFASKLYKEKLSEYISEVAYYKILERLCKKKELAKVTKGIYYVPNINRYGVVPLSEKYIIEAFTRNDTGTVIGYAMYNSLNLTTQVSKTVNVLSSTLEGVSKTVGNVVVKRVQIEYSEQVKNMIRVLEVLQNFYRIQDINYSEFIKFSKNIASTYDNEIFGMVIAEISYKKSTIAFLKEILDYYGVSNDLEKYLSVLSTYKYPRMEELYEIARI